MKSRPQTVYDIAEAITFVAATIVIIFGIPLGLLFLSFKYVAVGIALLVILAVVIVASIVLTLYKYTRDR